MSRRNRYLKAPLCQHHAAIWEAHHAAVTARRNWDGPIADNVSPPPWPTEPKGASGYCEDCRRALYASPDPWPAEVWAFLNQQAVNDCEGKGRPLLFAPRKLPPAPKARTETPAKHLARLTKAYADKLNDHKCTAVIGRPTVDGYRLTATNAHCALLEEGKGTGEPLAYRGWTASADSWVDLPPAFHLALMRVALLASERSHAITLTIDGAEVVIGTKNFTGEATERVALLATSSTAPTGTVCLDAEYLDPVCGVWPLRWYVQDEMSPQLFAPVGSEYRAVIMPMRQ